MADRNSFEQDVAKVRADAAKTKAELVARLKRLRPEELARVPREDLEQLTYVEFCAILRTAAPGAKTFTQVVVRPEPAMHRRLRDRWTELSLWQRSLRMMVAAGLAALLILALGPTALTFARPPAPLVRSVQSLNWPRCPRLTQDADGCLYVPTQSLSWDYVAAQLGISKAALLSLNTHLPRSHAPADKNVMVWRNRGLLENRP